MCVLAGRVTTLQHWGARRGGTLRWAAYWSWHEQQMIQGAALFMKISVNISLPLFWIPHFTFVILQVLWPSAAPPPPPRPPSTLVWALSMRMNQLSNTMPRNKFGNVTLPRKRIQKGESTNNFGISLKVRLHAEKIKFICYKYEKSSHIFTCREIYTEILSLRFFCFLCFFTCHQE